MSVNYVMGVVHNERFLCAVALPGGPVPACLVLAPRQLLHLRIARAICFNCSLSMAVVQGERRPRLEGEEYYSVVQEFCQAVRDHWPNCLLQVRAALRHAAPYHSVCPRAPCASPGCAPAWPPAWLAAVRACQSVCCAAPTAGRTPPDVF